jgi:hypothetical protein
MLQGCTQLRNVAPGGSFPKRSEPTTRCGRLRLTMHQLYSPGCEFLTARLLPEGDGHRFLQCGLQISGELWESTAMLSVPHCEAIPKV